MVLRCLGASEKKKKKKKHLRHPGKVSKVSKLKKKPLPLTPDPACPLPAGLTPSVALQMQWPPVGIHAIGYEGRALVMSAVLAASYYSANVAMVAREPKVGERGGGGGRGAGF